MSGILLERHINRSLELYLPNPLRIIQKYSRKPARLVPLASACGARYQGREKPAVIGVTKLQATDTEREAISQSTSRRRPGPKASIG